MIAKRSLIKVAIITLAFAVTLAGCVGKVKGTVESLTNEFLLQPSSAQISINQSLKFIVPSANGAVSFEVYSGFGNINSDGLFTASAVSGSVVIKATDSVGKTLYASVDVVEAPIISTQENILVESTVGLAVAGGKPPYTFQIKSVNGSEVGSVDSNKAKFIAPSSSGQNEIIVTDSLGATSTARVSIINPLRFSNASLSVSIPTQIGLSGGIGSNYQFILTGAGSFDSTTRTFTPSSVASTSILKAIDEMGNQAYLILNSISGTTLNDLIVTSVSSNVSAGQTVQLAVEGSSSGLNFQVISGGGSVNSSGVFTAPSTGGTSVVQVTDSNSHVGTVTITTQPTLSVSFAESNQSAQTPESSVPLEPNGSLTINPSQGVGPFTVTTMIGGITDSQSSNPQLTLVGTGPFVYTAPNQAGLDSISIRDSSGVTQTFYIVIAEPLRLVPSQIYVQKLSQFQFLSSGGKSPYTYSIVNGLGLVSEEGIFSASEESGETLVKVVDSQGREATAKVNVLTGLEVTPFYRVVSANKIVNFVVSGGLAPYSVQIESGLGKLCETESLCSLLQLSSQGSFTYKAPGVASSESLRIVDSAGTQVLANVEVKGALSLSISGSSLSFGDKVKLVASGGVGPFSLTLSTADIVTQSQISSSQWEISGQSNGTVIATVVDAEGSTATQSITVSFPAPIALLNSLPSSVSSANALNVSVGGYFVTHYKYKVGLSAGTDCTLSSDYSAEIAVGTGITADLSALGDGNLKLCVVAKNSGQVWQSTTSPTEYSWIRETSAPTAVLTGEPSGVNSISLTDILVSGAGVTQYKYQIANGSNATACTGNYTNAINVSLKLSATVIGDGPKVICVLAKGQMIWQSSPTTVSWAADFSGPTFSNDIADGAFSNSLTNTPSITYTAAIENYSTIVSNHVRVMQDATIVQDWVVHTPGSSVTGLTLQSGLTYRVQVRAINSLGLISTIMESDGFAVDVEGPSSPANLQLGATPHGLAATPTLSWQSSSDSGSGIQGYQVQVWQDSATDTLIKDWTSLTSGSALNSGISLAHNAQYYFKLRAVDNVSNFSAEVLSSNWTADETVDCTVGTPAVGSICVGGAIYIGTRSPGATSGTGTDHYMTTPGGCGDIPAGQVSGGSGASAWSSTDFTPTCSGTDWVAKFWNDGTSNYYNIPGITNYTGNFGTGVENSNLDANYGSANTQNMVAITSGAQGGYHAAAWYCDKLNVAGYSDWYLPNRYELTLIAGTPSNITRVRKVDANDDYFSSTEQTGGSDSGGAWSYRFWDGSSGALLKNIAKYVRCVRRIDKVPDPMIFNAVGLAALNQNIESNVVLVSGIEGAITLSVSGASGSPQVAKSTDGGNTWSSWASSQEVSAGNKIKLRLSVGNTEGALYTAILSSPSMSNVDWKVFSQSSSGLPATLAPSSILHHFKFDNNLLNNGTLNTEGTAIGSITYVEGVNGSAYQMNGSTSVSVTRRMYSNYTANGLSFCSWMKGNDVNVTSTNYSVANTLIGDSTTGVFIGIGVDQGKAAIMGDGQITKSAKSVADNEWHHTCFVLNYLTSTWNVKVFVDGVQEATGTLGTGGNPYYAFDHIGKTYPYTQWFGYSFDDLFIVDKAISADEVLFLAKQTIDNSPESFSFNQVFGAPLNQDQESNVVTLTGFNGTLNAAVSGASGNPQMAVSTDGGTTWSAWSSAQTVGSGDKVKLKVSVGSTEGQQYTTSFSFNGIGSNQWLVKSYMSDACLGTPTPGTDCGNGSIYVGSFGGFKYFTTPGNCTDSANPICDGGVDSLKKNWGAEGFTSGATSMTDGLTNTNSLATSYTDTYAAKYCHGMNYGGASDWFLPARDELDLLWSNKASFTANSKHGLVLGGGNGVEYWSSSEGNPSGYAYYQRFDNGTINVSPKGHVAYPNGLFVRCMRKH